MRFLTWIILVFISVSVTRAEEPAFSKRLRASLFYRVEPRPGDYYPHLLEVYLRLENPGEVDVDYVTHGPESLQAEVYDAKGKPVRQSVMMTSIMFGPDHFKVPPYSRLDWLISSSGGVTLRGDAKKNYALILGGNGWLLPLRQIGSYTLSVKLRGAPWAADINGADLKHLKLMIAPPPSRIKISH